MCIVCVCEVIFSTSMIVIMVIYTVQYLTDKDECTVIYIINKTHRQNIKNNIFFNVLL